MVMRKIAGIFRWTLILTIWGFTTYFLWNIGWLRAAIWLVPGLTLVVNVIRFATLPLYIFVGGSRQPPTFGEDDEGIPREPMTLARQNTAIQQAQARS